jgi:hypothetical protein
MPDLEFRIDGCEVAKFSTTPEIAFKLHLTNSDPLETIHTVTLRCQLQIEAIRRRYSPETQAELRDLFGEPNRWNQTLRSLLWTHVNLNVPAFQGSTVIALPVPCTFDFNVAATKYFHGVRDGEVPLCAMFSGSVFYSRDAEPMQVAPISWDKETRFTFPVEVWRDMMDSYYEGVAWLCLRRDVFERLYRYKVQRGIPTWEQAVESILQAEDAVRT